MFAESRLFRDSDERRRYLSAVRVAIDRQFQQRAVRVSETPNDREIAVAGLLLKHLQLLQFNAHEVFETRLGNEHRFRGSRPLYIGVAIYPTVARFNHDCYPAVTRYPTALVIPTDRPFVVHLRA